MEDLRLVVHLENHILFNLFCTTISSMLSWFLSTVYIKIKKSIEIEMKLLMVVLNHVFSSFKSLIID
jgi:hypothetical protein